VTSNGRKFIPSLMKTGKLFKGRNGRHTNTDSMVTFSFKEGKYAKNAMKDPPI
jgi:hypothetical protein